MNRQTRECRLAEWADLVGETVPDRACEAPRSLPALRRGDRGERPRGPSE